MQRFREFACVSLALFFFSGVRSWGVSQVTVHNNTGSSRSVVVTFYTGTNCSSTFWSNDSGTAEAGGTFTGTAWYGGENLWAYVTVSDTCASCAGQITGLEHYYTDSCSQEPPAVYYTNYWDCMWVTNNHPAMSQNFQFFLIPDGGNPTNPFPIWKALPREYREFCITNNQPFTWYAAGDLEDYYGGTGTGQSGTNQVPNGGGSGDVQQPTNQPPVLQPPPSMSNSPPSTVGGQKAQMDQTAEIGRTAHTDATNIVSQIVNMKNTIVSNGITVIGLTNVATETTLRGVTNLLGSAGGTNFYLTNYAGMSGTNGPGAWVSGSNAVAGTVGDFGEALGEIGEAPTIGVGSTNGVSFLFCGQVFDLNPNVRFPGLLEFSRQAWTFLLIFGFVWFVGRLLAELARTFATVEAGGIPNLMATVLGTGGNYLGLVVAGVVALALCVVWLIVFDWVFGQVLGELGLQAAGEDFVGMGGNDLALWLLVQAFPVQVALNLAWLAIGLQFGFSQLVLVSAAASRFLLGK